MKNKYTFPNNFWWGAATSGPQSEGSFDKLHKNIFDYWFETEPTAFFNEVGPNIASNFYNSYADDLKLMKDVGLNSFRTSIQWTRLIKDFETGEVDELGVSYYNNVIDETIKNGMIPVINLHHFDLPIELYEKYGGWESKHVVDLFVLYAKQCFKLFGDRVKDWITFNEPIVIVEGGYLYSFHYPKICDGKKAVQVLFNLNLTTAKVIKAFRDGKYDGRIGIVLNLTPCYPKSALPEDVAAAEFAEDFFNRSFLEPSVHGTFPTKLIETFNNDNVMFEYTQSEMDDIKSNTIDFLGVNYYQPMRVKSKSSDNAISNTWTPDKYFDYYEPENRRMNHYRGWEIYPQAMYDIAITMRNTYKNIPWFISENGMGVENESRFLNNNGVIEDDYRIEFLEEHLSYLHKGIAEGSNCFGYHMWTPIDCWSWTNAYKNRYGFISLDLETGNKTIKKSGDWMKLVSKNNFFESELY